MIQDEFDICGTHIPYASIEDYQVVQREYIYRPVYRERAKRGFSLKKAEYEFSEMLPFAAVLINSDSDYKLATKGTLTSTLGGAIVKDIAVGALSMISSKMNRKRYHCKNVAGRCFTTYLDDVPALLIRDDGKMSDVYKHDALYRMLGEPIAPAVMIVKALLIRTKKYDHLFYGNRIQLENVEQAYTYLRESMNTYKLEQAPQKKERSLKMPHFGQKLLSGVANRLAEYQTHDEPDDT